MTAHEIRRGPLVLGLMSGTSADGVDAALLDLSAWPALGSPGAAPPGSFPAHLLSSGAPRARVVAHTFTPYPPALRQAVLEAMRGGAHALSLTQLHWALGEVMAKAALTLSGQADLIAMHGQTVQHHPRTDEARAWARVATLQLGEAAVVAQHTGKRIVSDFRPPDMAAGGQGAPLVPWADWALFAQAGVQRSLHNLGGISNLTVLNGLDVAEVRAFDTGPANCLIDEVAALAGLNCDENGALALAGEVHAPTLARWLTHPELRRAPPKATGREVWTLEQLGYSARLSLPDLAATATAFTAQTVALAYQRWVGDIDDVVVAGGGARNPALLKALRLALAPLPVKTFFDLGWDQQGFTDATHEAAAFALLGYARAQGWANTLPQVTGAQYAVSAGKISLPPLLTPASEDALK